MPGRIISESRGKSGNVQIKGRENDSKNMAIGNGSWFENKCVCVGCVGGMVRAVSLLRQISMA